MIFASRGDTYIYIYKTMHRSSGYIFTGISFDNSNNFTHLHGAGNFTSKQRSCIKLLVYSALFTLYVYPIQILLKLSYNVKIFSDSKYWKKI